MNFSSWVMCLKCGRGFAANLSREPRRDGFACHTLEPILNFAAELQMEQQAHCPFEDCNGSIDDFVWWNDVRLLRQDLPETPEPDRAYQF